MQTASNAAGCHNTNRYKIQPLKNNVVKYTIDWRC